MELILLSYLKFETNFHSVYSIPLDLKQPNSENELGSEFGETIFTSNIYNYHFVSVKPEDDSVHVSEGNGCLAFSKIEAQE